MIALRKDVEDIRYPANTNEQAPVFVKKGATSGTPIPDILPQHDYLRKQVVSIEMHRREVAARQAVLPVEAPLVGQDINDELYRAPKCYTKYGNTPDVRRYDSWMSAWASFTDDSKLNEMRHTRSEDGKIVKGHSFLYSELAPFDSWGEGKHSLNKNADNVDSYSRKSRTGTKLTLVSSNSSPHELMTVEWCNDSTQEAIPRGMEHLRRPQTQTQIFMEAYGLRQYECLGPTCDDILHWEDFATSDLPLDHQAFLVADYLREDEDLMQVLEPRELYEFVGPPAKAECPLGKENLTLGPPKGIPLGIHDETKFGTQLCIGLGHSEVAKPQSKVLYPMGRDNVYGIPKHVNQCQDAVYLQFLESPDLYWKLKSMDTGKTPLVEENVIDDGYCRALASHDIRMEHAYEGKHTKHRITFSMCNIHQNFRGVMVVMRNNYESGHVNRETYSRAIAHYLDQSAEMRIKDALSVEDVAKTAMFEEHAAANDFAEKVFSGHHNERLGPVYNLDKNIEQDFCSRNGILVPNYLAPAIE